MLPTEPGLNVSHAQFAVTCDKEDFHCKGLGGGLVVLALDATHHVAGMAHFLVPASHEHHDIERPCLTVEQGFPRFLEALENAGADRSAIAWAGVGGSSPLHRQATHDHDFLDVGKRNVSELEHHLAELSAKLDIEDFFGYQRRDIKFNTHTGLVIVRTFPSPERVVGCLSPAHGHQSLAVRPGERESPSKESPINVAAIEDFVAQEQKIG